MNLIGLLLLASVTAPPGATAPLPPPPVAFHAVLERSAPADGDTLTAPPSEVRLIFSGAVEEIGASVTLHGTTGGPADLAARATGDERRTITASLPDLAPGDYSVDWRVISADGHPVEGSLAFFVVGPSGEGDLDVPGPPPDTLEGGTAADEEMEADAPGTDGDAEQGHSRSVTTFGLGAGTDLSLLGLFGLLFFAGWRSTGASARTDGTAVALAVAAVLLSAAHAWTWVGEALGSGADAGARLDALFSLGSGRPLAARVGFVALAGGALVLARRKRLALAFAALAVVAGSGSGHPASTQPVLAIPANALHLLAVGAWTGGLLYLLTEYGSDDYPGVAHRVSGVALLSVVVVAVTGLLQAWLFVGGLEALIQTTYGRLVLAKVAGLAILIAFGAYHRFRVLPALGEEGAVGAKSGVGAEGGDRVLSRSVRRELAVAGAVVVVAAILGHVPPAPPGS